MHPSECLGRRLLGNITTYNYHEAARTKYPGQQGHWHLWKLIQVSAVVGILLGRKYVQYHTFSYLYDF